MNIKGTLSFLILHILSEGDNHGYQINKLIHERSSQVLDFKEGTLYPTLHKLENEGCVHSSIKPAGNRKKRHYKITDKGQKRLQAELAYWYQYIEAVDRVLGRKP